ncbi:DUF5677 domain-containing protein [Adlercreutzia agrestimuris]|uniref:DUF5677 domain-containing protein n=1 Tax=Adlercreutzia agrestimuris TaxID=2941324 RepID=UPI00203B2C73|nr:DUF5677 domain-containing protein [Adlercreutzia agrestimuris]
MEEIGKNEECPCGRGKKYKKCCKRKGIRWYRDDEGSYFSKCEASIPEEFLESFDQSQNRFYDLFGREPDPDDLVIYDAERHSNSYYKALIPLLRECGISESWIYAMYRTDGLMPNAMNEKYITQYDLDAFAAYIKEYEEIKDEIDHWGDKREEGELNVSVPALVMIGSKIIEKQIENIASSLTIGLNYFLNYQNKGRGDIEAVPCTLTEYVSFVAIRTTKTLNSISKLLEISEPGSIYALGRSLFESYVYLRAINCDTEFFSSKIFPSLSFNEYGFEIEDGIINYRKIKVDSLFGSSAPKRSNKDVLKFGDVCKKYGTDVDEELRSLFYRYACQFVHIDALTARSIFYEPDLYTEFDESLIAAACSLSMATILLEEFANLSITPNQQKADLLFLVGNLASDLCDCFMILVMDGEQSDEMYEVFLKRLLKVESNTWKRKEEYLAMREGGA